MDALSEAIVRLLRRQDATERRLEEIEKALGITCAPAPQPKPPPAPTPPPRVEVPPAIPPVEPPVDAAYQPLPRLETRLGLAWINRIGAVTLALCVAFIFKYAVDNAWI